MIDTAAHGTKKHNQPMMMGGNMRMMHNHDKWSTPPPPYKDLRNDSWDDQDKIAKGKELYEDNCEACHGVDGFGSGPLAEDLAHKPANLNHHFHMAPGKGDDYLFWRVSEGGTVEPFKSSKSAMPAFKEILNEEERWAVLSYVHKKFHKMFKLGGN